MNGKTQSLKKNILLHLLAAAALTFLLVEIFIAETGHRALQQSLQTALRSRARSLASLTEIHKSGRIEFEFDSRVMRDYRGPRPRAYFLIKRAADGSEVTRSESLRGVDQAVPASAARANRQKPFFWTGRIGEKKVRWIALLESIRREGRIGRRQSAAVASDKRNQLIYIVGENSAVSDRQFWEMIGRTSASLGAGLMLLLVSGGILVFRDLRPLLKLRKEVQAISPSRLEPVTIPETEEIAAISRTLNVVIGRVKESFERERRFTADVAHELRTPISEILSLAEVSLKWGDNSDEQTRKNYRDFLDSARQMKRIVVTLLALSRYDSGVLTEEKEEVAIKSFVLPIWKQFEKKAAGRRVTCDVDIAPHVSLRADKNILRTIMENLFRNAVDYTPRGGVIEWKASGRGSKFYFSISNTVTGLKADDLPHFFERFWRKDTARASDAHSGLGLSLVKALAEVSGLQVSARLTRPDLLIIVLQSA